MPPIFLNIFPEFLRKYFYIFLVTPKNVSTKFSKFTQNVLQVYGHGPNKNVDKITDISQEIFYIIFFSGDNWKMDILPAELARPAVRSLRWVSGLYRTDRVDSIKLFNSYRQNSMPILRGWR